MLKNLPQAVIMDLGDTIIRNESFHFNVGLKYLHDEVLSCDVSYEDLSELARFLKENLFDLRSENNLEVKLIDYLKYLKAVYGFRYNQDLKDVELKFMKVAACDTLICSVVPLLEFFKKENICVYILSNSIFSSNTLKNLIREFGIFDYFEELISTSEYIFRKPHPGIFMVLDRILLKRISNYERSKTWFIGNDYKKDIIGSYGFGFFPVWYNEIKNDNYMNIEILDIENYFELLKMLESVGK